MAYQEAGWLVPAALSVPLYCDKIVNFRIATCRVRNQICLSSFS
jgi:hypothetical protein